MLYSFKNKQDLEELEELVLLKNQVDELRLQDKLGKQNFHEHMKKLYQALSITRYVSRYNKNYSGNFY